MSNIPTLSQLSRDWLSMANEYRPSAFWFWNAEMDDSQIEASVTEMARNGIREFLIHPSHGMTIEYLSHEYFQQFRLTLDLARKYELKVWVYDEYAWPSGVAGGKLLEEYPDFCGWILRFDRDKHGNVSACPQRQNRVMDNVVGAPWTKHTPGYVDTLSKDAIAKFIEMTHQRVYNECREYFDDVIVGFFTDEPMLMVGCLSQDYGMFDLPSVPWTPELPKWFEERFGYDLEAHYAELADGGPSTVKSDYWQLIKDVHSETYHGQIGRWCREHDVKYTGHLVSEDWPINHVRFSGSMFQCMKHMDIPGIDYLGCLKKPEDRFWEQVIVASIARHTGSKHVYCEAYNLSPLDLRLGRMLREAQLFGIHGVDDIALMAFPQRWDGIRKRCLWPPIFTNAPWWQFYDLFRDAFARSLSLTSLGNRNAKYAVLYPQEQLEQTSTYTSCHDETEVASRMIKQSGLAVYSAYETYDFVFPEILNQAHVENDCIIFPHAEYQAILAPSEVAYSDASMAELDRIRQAGGQVIDDLQAVEKVAPSWQDMMAVKIGPKSNACRIYRFDYPDGTLFAIRNVTEELATIEVSTHQALTEWDSTQGRCVDRCGQHKWEINPYSTQYFSISDRAFGPSEASTQVLPIQTEWTIATERPNMAYLSNVQFHHPEHDWVDADDWGYSSLYRSSNDRRFATVVPKCLAGQREITMRGEFICEVVPEQLGMLFESEHLDSLTINGVSIDLNSAKPMPVWDSSCTLVDIRHAVRSGKNLVSGIIRFSEWESSIFNDAFLTIETAMPSCDLRLAGAFRLTGDKITRDSDSPITLPLDLAEAGFSQYTGIAILRTQVDVDSERIIGLSVDPISEDSLEVLIDGVSVGRGIVRPYNFTFPSLSSGRHELQLQMASTSANILDQPAPWGIRSVSWILSEN